MYIIVMPYKNRDVSSVMKPTMMFRYERRAKQTSTQPADIMQVIIGKQYPTVTTYELVLQQLWTEDQDYPKEEWRDIPVVDQAEPINRRKLIMENIAQNKEFAEKVREESKRLKKLSKPSHKQMNRPCDR